MPIYNQQFQGRLLFIYISMVFDFQGYHTDFTTNPGPPPTQTNSCNLTIPGETSTQTTSFGGFQMLPSLKLTFSHLKMMVGVLLSFWDGLFSGDMLVLGRVFLVGVDCPPFFPLRFLFPFIQKHPTNIKHCFPHHFPLDSCILGWNS